VPHGHCCNRVTADLPCLWSAHLPLPAARWMRLLSGESLSIIVTDAIDAARADPVYVMQKRESALIKSAEAPHLQTEVSGGRDTETAGGSTSERGPQ
jgi:hypothetical protein